MKKKSAADSHPMPGQTYDGELRTHLGNVGHWQNGFVLALGQDGETYSMWDYDHRYASISWQFGITQMNNGKWLSSQFDYTLSNHSLRVVNGKFQTCEKMFFNSREQALRASVARLIRCARGRRRTAQPQFRIRCREYEVVIAWLYHVLQKPAPMSALPREKAPEPFIYLPEEMDTMVLSHEEASNPQLMLLKVVGA